MCQAIGDYGANLEFFSKPGNKILDDAKTTLRHGKTTLQETLLMQALVGDHSDRKIRNGCRNVLKQVRDEHLQLPRYLLEKARQGLTMDLSK